MRRIFTATVLVLAFCFLLTACELDRPQQTTQAGSDEYSGSLDNYTYRYESGANRRWEEDVLYVAEVFLGEVFANGHPLLTDMEFQTTFSMDGKEIEYRTFYDDALREEFLQDINELIRQIPDLNSYEILFALQKSVAKLSDLHSSVHLSLDERYPLFLTPFYTETGVEYRAVILPAEHSNLLFSRLTAINGVSVEELTELLRPYISCENEYALVNDVNYMLVYGEALDVIGITDGIEDAVFTFEILPGLRQEITLSAQPYNRLDFSELMGYTLDMTDALLYRDTESYYWWEYVEEDQLLYVRFNQIMEDRDLVYSSFVKQLREHIQAVPETKKVVIDLRENPGGQFHASLSHYLSSFLNQLEGQESYVLIDSASYSSAIWLASNLRQMAPDTLFIGSPGGQPANFFGSVHSYSMPNSETSFSMSDSLLVTNEQDTLDALMPDVVVHQTLEAYIQGIDSVLAYILSDAESQSPDS